MLVRAMTRDISLLCLQKSSKVYRSSVNTQQNLTGTVAGKFVYFYLHGVNQYITKSESINQYTDIENCNDA
jgi:hypothetical protein